MKTRGIAENHNDLKILELIQSKLGVSVDEDEYTHDFRIYAGLYHHKHELEAVEELFVTTMQTIDRHVSAKNLVKLGEISGANLVKETHRAVQDHAMPTSGGLHAYQGDNRDIILRLASDWGREGLLILLLGADSETRIASVDMLAAAHLESASSAVLDTLRGRLLRQKKSEIQQRLQNLSQRVRGIDEREGDSRFRALRLKLWKLDLMEMNPSELDFELADLVRQYDREKDELRRDPDLDSRQLALLDAQIGFIRELKSRGGVTNLHHQLWEPGDGEEDRAEMPHDWSRHNFCQAWTEEIETGAPWYAGLDFGGAGAPV